MPDWLKLEDPLARNLVLAAAAFLLLVLAARFIQRRRESAAQARRRAELRKTYGRVQLQKQEISRLAQQIIATSSTGSIAGFVIMRQIEAVFTDGHKTPADAVDSLKALAARQGANALINLASQRLPSGKCVANADAIIISPVDESPMESGPETEGPDQTD